MNPRDLKPWKLGDPVFGAVYLPDTRTREAHYIEKRAQYVLTLIKADTRRQAIEASTGHLRDKVRDRVLELWAERKNENQDT